MWLKLMTVDCDDWGVGIITNCGCLSCIWSLPLTWEGASVMQTDTIHRREITHLCDVAETDDFVDCVDREDVASSQTVVAYVVSIWCLPLTWEGASVTSLGYLLLASVTGVHVMQTDTVQQAYARSVGMLDCVDWAVKADVPKMYY